MVDGFGETIPENGFGRIVLNVIVDDIRVLGGGSSNNGEESNEMREQFIMIHQQAGNIVVKAVNESSLVVILQIKRREQRGEVDEQVIEQIEQIFNGIGFGLNCRVHNGEVLCLREGR